VYFLEASQYFRRDESRAVGVERAEAGDGGVQVPLVRILEHEVRVGGILAQTHKAIDVLVRQCVHDCDLASQIRAVLLLRHQLFAQDLRWQREGSKQHKHRKT